MKTLLPTPPLQFLRCRPAHRVHCSTHNPLLIARWSVLGCLSVLGVACVPGDDPVPASDTEAPSTSTGDPPEASTGTPTIAPDSTTGVDESTDGGMESDTDASTDDTADSTSGVEPVCGNGMVEAGETCDDAGESERCDDDCTMVACGDGVANATAGEACDDAGESAACNADCTPAACGDGQLNMTAGEACDDSGESVLCNDNCTPAACGDGTTNRTAGEACDDMGESMDCNADCSVALCGDGLINGSAGETCDDGGQSATCDVDCTLAECGDGVFNVLAGELCDTGGRSPACDADCTPVECGDGATNVAAGEDCDDAGESASCNSDCTTAVCGDGIFNVTAGESCDDAGASLSCDDDCTPVLCGDGNANMAAGEACDDMGESISCDADCTPATCGDGLTNVTAGEECDGIDLLGATCQDQGYAWGTLSCDGTCSFDTSACADLPGVPTLSVGFSPVKQFDFSWAPVAGADYYQLYERPEPGEPFGALGGDIMGTSVSHTMPLHYRYEASYTLRACNMAGCVDSAVVDVMDSLVDAVGYFKSSNIETEDNFGRSVAISGDGMTMAVGAVGEDSSASGIDGDQASNGIGSSGAVYIFTQDGSGVWSQQAYIKASNPGILDNFGWRVELSNDGSTLAVGAPYEDSSAAGVDGDQANNGIGSSGAAYVFTREGGAWSQQAYIKASNPGSGDLFGFNMTLSGDGNTLAVSSPYENSDATGIDGDQFNNNASASGAVYVFIRDGMGLWSQQAYIKSSNSEFGDHFGQYFGLSLNSDGNTLAVGAYYEASNATGINGNQANNSATHSGAVYVFDRDGMGTWTQQTYIKASNTGSGDNFGYSVALDDSGNTLAVGARGEQSNATGIGGDQTDNSVLAAGAVYVFDRDGMGVWSQHAYIKGLDPDPYDWFGGIIALSGDGETLAVASFYDDSSSTGIGGDPTDNSVAETGAILVYERDAMGFWSTQAFVKASNAEANDELGGYAGLAISDDGRNLVAAAPREDGGAVGIDGDQTDNTASNAGAVYVY